mmetsp:Transcript_9016/g.19063  ORF Transcript_9016/g.19063 Transcript_9016/m.19063 type:complete len:283 (+) Transcript_9016:52-900(+)
MTSFLSLYFFSLFLLRGVCGLSIAHKKIKKISNPQLFASGDQGSTNVGGFELSSEGAGSWRSKTKQFQESRSFSAEDKDRMLNIAFVTGNAMKQREINLILSSHGATSSDGNSFVNLRILDVDLPEIQEINTEAVAKNKAIQGAQLAGGACVVEDTSLEFNALGGMPGPFIKWFQDKLGCEGLYKILIGYEDKSATAVCTLAFCPYPHADPVLFTGKCKGKIVEPVPGRGTYFLPNIHYDLLAQSNFFNIRVWMGQYFCSRWRIRTIFLYVDRKEMQIKSSQ